MAYINTSMEKTILRFEENLKKNDVKYDELNKGTRSIKQLPKISSDEYLHMLYYKLDKNGQNNLIQKLKEIKGKDINIKDLLKLYTLCNGMVVYYGSLVLFGYTQKVDFKYRSEPHSIINVNLSSKCYSKDLIYIGSILNSIDNNYDVCYNVKNEEVEIVDYNKCLRKFKNLETFLNHMIDYYEICYDKDGYKIDKTQSKLWSNACGYDVCQAKYIIRLLGELRAKRYNNK